ncbi:MAG: D-glycerate dehydrogenase [Candidatus Micrarchaeota archaeon]
MNRPKVFVTRPLPGHALEELKRHCDVELQEEDRPATREEITEGVKGKDGLLCILTDQIDIEVMDANKNLRIISNYGVGFDKIDLDAATKRKILVTNTPGALTETTADLAVGVMIAAARRIVEGDKFTRECRYEGWGPSMMLGQDVHNKTLGLVGLGRIGKAVAKRAHFGFGMKILYNDPKSQEDFDKEFNARLVDFETLLKESDFISIHVPLTPQTRKMFGDKQFHMMKRTAVLVNTSRGLVVDQAALGKALKSSRIFAAAIDVYEDEPKSPVELIPLQNVILLPHIGSASLETRTRMADLAVQNLLDYFKGRHLTNVVNKDLLGK